MKASAVLSAAPDPKGLAQLFHSVRRASRLLTAELSDADATAQSMADASPAKWHLDHTTWFFENIVLMQHFPGYRVFDDRFNFLFNSYYDTLGDRHPRPMRELLTRPTLDTVYSHREHVDAGIERLLARCLGAEVSNLIELGCHHEQLHHRTFRQGGLRLRGPAPPSPTRCSGFRRVGVPRARRDGMHPFIGKSTTISIGQ